MHQEYGEKDGRESYITLEEFVGGWYEYDGRTDAVVMDIPMESSPDGSVPPNLTRRSGFLCSRDQEVLCDSCVIFLSTDYFSPKRKVQSLRRSRSQKTESVVASFVV